MSETKNWEDVVGLRNKQVADAAREASGAKNAIRESQSRGRQPRDPDLRTRGEAATRHADLQEAERAARRAAGGKR